MTAVLQAHIRSKFFGFQQVLDDVSIDLKEGEVVSLVGASGCGKSTLLRILAGLDTDFEGRLSLQGHALHGRTPDIGFIFQEPRLFPWLTVLQNVGFGVAHPSVESHRRARELLIEVGLGGFEQALPKSLSGGQAQRVAIARGLFHQPRVLLLDEPFSAVDAFTRMTLQQLLIRLAQQHGITLLLVTHDIDEAAYLSDRVLVLEANPGVLRETVPVPLDHPRDRTDPLLAQARAAVFEALQRAHAL